MATRRRSLRLDVSHMGATIEELRNAAGLSRESLARRIGLESADELLAVEKGNKEPTVHDVWVLAHELGTDPNRIMGWADGKTIPQMKRAASRKGRLRRFYVRERIIVLVGSRDRGEGFACTKHDMAKAVGCCEQSVTLAVKRLKNERLLTVSPRLLGNGAMCANVYALSAAGYREYRELVQEQSGW